jgi:hypothetical protein
VKAFWEKERLPSENALAKRFTYAVDAAEEEPTTCQKNGAPHAVMENPQPSGSIHGRLKISTEKEHAKTWELIRIRCYYNSLCQF